MPREMVILIDFTCRADSLPRPCKNLCHRIGVTLNSQLKAKHTMANRLDLKLSKILSGHAARSDFIIADAKDADMGFAICGPGPVLGADGKPAGRMQSCQDYLAKIRQVVNEDLVDIMLLSLNNFDRLNREGMFANTAITPAVRFNDATDIWNTRHAEYLSKPSHPFRTVNLARARDCGTALGLYSMTFVNDLDSDLATLNAYREFRLDADANGLAHFLEVFNPNIETGFSQVELGEFVNDCIIHALAGMAQSERPRFLKIAYNGARAMEELAGYDSQIVVGVLGGASGTTADAFNLLDLAQKHGARVALFGRKINLAESQTDILKLMRAVVDGGITPDDAVIAYHDALAEKGIVPIRPLDRDREVTDPVLLADL